MTDRLNVSLEGDDTVVINGEIRDPKTLSGIRRLMGEPFHCTQNEAVQVMIKIGVRTQNVRDGQRRGQPEPDVWAMIEQAVREVRGE